MITLTALGLYQYLIGAILCMVFLASESLADSMSTYKKPPLADLQKALSCEAFDVTQKGSTERPFKNAYWDHHEPGIYVDVVSGEPLFSSLDKKEEGYGDFVRLFEPQQPSNAPGPGVGPKPQSQPPKPVHAKATFAGGCFWCMESPFDQLPGVISVTVGYTGGSLPNPTYDQVSSGSTGHAEAVEIVFDPERISYQQLLDVFWRQINPTTPNRQFCDVGSQYRPAIFVHDAAQKKAAEASRDALAKSSLFSQEIATEITPATVFYPAEAYHQQFYKKNPIRYKYYRDACGRDQFLQKIWESPGAQGLKR